MEELEIGTKVKDRYVLKKLQGRGGFGEVWLAYDEILECDVAIKLYISLDSQGIEEFKSEYITAQELHHQNLLTPSYLDIWQHRPFLVMKYCAKGSVANFIGKMDEPMLWQFIHDVAAGLAHLHNRPEPIVHQDIKPYNVLVDEDFSFLITDFGISKKIRSTMRKQSSRATGAGATAYMGPERFEANPEPIMASDIWSLGASIYEIATGELPFSGFGGGMQKNGAEMPSLDGNWSEDMNMVMQSCLAKETWDRPTASQLEEYTDAKIKGKPVKPAWKTETPATGGEEKDAIGKTVPVGGVENGNSVGRKSSPTKKPRRKGNWIFLGVIVIAFMTIFLFNHVFDSTHVGARRNLDEYNRLVEVCSQIAYEDNSDAEALEKAKNNLVSIGDFESKYSYVNKHYGGKYRPLKEKIDEKSKKLAKQWTDAADAQVRIGRMENISKAVEFYSTSLSLYDDSEIRAKLEENEAKILTYMNPIAIELKGEGNYNEKLYAEKIKYLYIRLKYEGLDPVNSHPVRLIVKIYNNDKLKYNSDLYSSTYTFHDDVDVEPGSSSKYIDLKGWGSKSGGIYSKGSLRVEIWHGDKKLTTKEATIY